MGTKDQEEGKRPTPVRKVMEVEAEEDREQEQAAESQRTIMDPASDEEWVVTVEGRSGSGILPLRTIPLLELTFAPVQEPDKPLRMATSPGTDLERFRDHELLDLLRSARPYRPPMERPSPKKRRGKKSRRSSGG